jgi:hypothetical protein
MLYTIWLFHGGDYEECRLLDVTRETERNIPEDGILYCTCSFGVRREESVILIIIIKKYPSI